jgi:hypothetical protein
MTDDKRPDDADWLNEAFDRALRGDNGVAPDAARPAPSPFGATPPTAAPDSDEPIRHNELDLDFETESAVPPQAFVPVVDFGDEPDSDENEPEPDPFAVFSHADPVPPTEAMDLIDAPVTAAPAAVADPPPTESLDGLASLFSDDKFADATTAVIAAPTAADATRSKRKTVTTPTDPSVPLKQPGTPAKAVTYGIAAGLTVLLGIGGFVLGTTLGGGPVAPEPTETAESGATATREPGTWAWTQLFGGECVDPFPGAWAESFEVVDCAVPHAAQLVSTGDLAASVGSSFPGVEEAAALTETACSAQGVLDLTAAGAYPNIQLSVSYAPTQEQWDAGNTAYYCFVSLADATPITGSLTSAGSEITE